MGWNQRRWRDVQARAREAPLRVSSISPGIVETEFYQTSRFGDEAGAQKFYSSMKNLQAADIAQVPPASLMHACSVPGPVVLQEIVVLAGLYASRTAASAAGSSAAGVQAYVLRDPLTFSETARAPPD